MCETTDNVLTQLPQIEVNKGKQYTEEEYSKEFGIRFLVLSLSLKTIWAQFFLNLFLMPKMVNMDAFNAFSKFENQISSNKRVT